MLRKIENLLLALAAVTVIILGLLITASVTTRALFGIALPDTIVLVRELMVAAIILPLAATTRERSHVAVEFLSDRFPAKLRAICIIFGSLFGLIALAPLVYASGREFLHMVSSGGYFFGDLDLPKWPGRALFFLGISLCWIRLIVLAAEDIRSMKAGTSPDTDNIPGRQ